MFHVLESRTEQKHYSELDKNNSDRNEIIQNQSMKLFYSSKRRDKQLIEKKPADFELLNRCFSLLKFQPMQVYL